MELLQVGVDCSVIALWLGHESIETTQTYLHAHLALKEAALARLKPYNRSRRTRFKPSDRPLAFLEACKRPNYAKWNAATFARCVANNVVTTKRYRSVPWRASG
jgi:hypothetical protein